MKNRGEEFYYPAINELAMDVSQSMVLVGFEPAGANNIDRKLLLAVGEIVEAHEEVRKGADLTRVYVQMDSKPEGFPTEIADAIIRLLAVAHDLDINIAAVINQKMQFESTRPFRHGRKF